MHLLGVIATILAVLFHSVIVSADQAESLPELPEPLTLQAALELIDSSHPLVALAAATASSQNAALQRIKAQDDLSLTLSLQGRWIEPSELAQHGENNDSRGYLRLRKNLFDFGKTRHNITAAEQAELAGQSLLNRSHYSLRQLVMQRYFDVLQADLAAATANEAMAIAFIGFNKAQDRSELGDITEIDLLGAEDAYQQQLLVQRQATQAQRQTRDRLALALNRPGSLSSTLLEPQLTGLRNPLPDFEVMHKELSGKNAQLLALKSQLEANSSTVEAARLQQRPTVYAEIEAAEYYRETSSRDPLTATLGVDIPLFRGGRRAAIIKKAEAERLQTQARLRQLEFQLREELLETLFLTQRLIAQLEAAEVRMDFRDYTLDRSRAEYELELKTDLGRNMAEQSAAREYQASTMYKLALSREKLVELTGNASYSALADAVKHAETEAE